MKKQHFSVLGDKNGVLAEACRGLAEGLQRACRGLGEGLAMSWRGLERTWKELGRVLGTMCRRGVGSNCRMDERNYMHICLMFVEHGRRNVMHRPCYLTEQKRRGVMKTAC